MPVSVVIPAHNEEAVIGRCLEQIQAHAEDGELDIVVVCNGCRDRTAEVARRSAPSATVLEIALASKVAALNLGDKHASHFPRFYLDADIELTIESVRLIAEVLAGGKILCASPQPFFSLGARPWAIRAFYDVWASTPYRADGMGGAGIYALSKEGRARFGSFPELTADDQFVQQLFHAGERCSVDGARSLVHPPLTVRSLLATRVRAYRGRNELASSAMALARRPASGARAALERARKPADIPAVAVYIGINATAKVMARSLRRRRWERDDSARAQNAGPGARLETSRLATKICYVTSHYPALSHSFILREVQGLRAAGVQVATVSVHRVSGRDLHAEMDREEADRTWNILPVDLASFAGAHLRALSTHPWAYAKTTLLALRSAPPGAKALLWQLFYFAEAIALWSHAAAIGGRHFHAHLANVASDVSWLACAYGEAAEGGWSWSFTMHGPTELYAVDRFNLRRKIEAARAVVCVSEFTRSQLMYISAPEQWGKLHIVHCGVDLERYHYVPAAPKDHLEVLSVCRLVPQKGLDVLFEAMTMLHAGGTSARLTLVGTGQEEARLRKRASELHLDGSIDFAGAVGQDDIFDYYTRSDVVCLPSFAEGLPVVLMEAMATGRPVVATLVAGVPELVKDGASGFLVPAGSARELADALVQLAASPELRHRVGLEGRRKVEAEFDSASEAAKLARLFAEIAGEPTPRGRN